MTSFCTIHNTDLEWLVSKNGKKYQGHRDESGKMCFGEGLGKAIRNGRTEGYNKFKETGDKLFNKTEDAGMSKKDWNFKEFTKGLAVFSASARQEGMDPVTAFREMHIADWLRVSYGDMEGYEEWIVGLKTRLANLNQKEIKEKFDRSPKEVKDEIDLDDEEFEKIGAE